MKKKIPIRFFIVTFTWSWLIWLPLILANYRLIPVSKELLTVITMPVSILAAFGPAVGAFVSLHTLQGKGSIGIFLKSFLSLKFGWKAWTSIILIFSISTAIAWYTPELFGENRLPMLLPHIYIFPLYWLFIVLFGGGQEEIGWRAYILPFLEDRFGSLKGSTILGLVWACWHIPLWFIAGTSQTYMHFAGFVMLMLGYSFIFSWIMKSSGRRPLAGLIVHGTANAFVPVFPTIIMTLGVPQIRFWIWTSLTLIIGIIIAIVRSYNHKKTAEFNHE